MAQQLNRASLAHQIHERLRARIIQGELVGGTRLVELDLAQQLEVSQAAIREALARLEQDGLVERKGRTGTYVTEISVQHMVELFTVRSVIEGFAVQHTIRTMSAATITALETSLMQMRLAADNDDMMTLAIHDMQFHHSLCSGSTSLLRAWTPLYLQIQRFITITNPHRFASLHEIAETHAPILAAVQARDAVRAAELVRHHIMSISERLK
jgi:DNA-binding GntR family transcriptional regulator